MKVTLEILKQVKDRIKISEGVDCFEHTGYKNKDGYRQFQFNFEGIKYNIDSHRAVFMIFHNVQLENIDVVMHSCDNPGCINISHLSVGTHFDNVKDRVMKNRSAEGVNNGRYVHGKYVGRNKKRSQIKA